MHYLKQSTATTVTVGPLIDEVDFITPITSVTPADITAGLIKGTTNGAITLTASGGNNDFTHIANGIWSLELTSGNTDTLGRFRVHMIDADGFLPTFADFEVLAANVYDSLIGGGDTLDVQVAGMDAATLTAAAIATDAIDGDALAASALAEINTQCDTALTDYAGPTKAEMDTAHALLATPTQVNTQCDTALSDYAGPTKAEMDTAHALLATPAQVNTEVDTALGTTTYAELSAVPSAASTLADKINFIFEWCRNKFTQTATEQKLFKDDSATILDTHTISDDGTTFTRNKGA